MATSEIADKRLLTGQDRTQSQQEADEELCHPLGEMAWELNRLYHELGKAPTKEDIQGNTPHSYDTYCERFGRMEEVLKAANVPIEEYEMRLRNAQCKVPLYELARDINHTYHELGEVPRWRDIYESGDYHRRTYERRFNSVQQALRLSNVKAVVDYVIEAMKEYVASGMSYATCKQLRSFMYPGGDMTDVSQDFGVDNSVPQNKEEEVVESWDYPQFSPRRITSAIQEIRDGDYEVDVEAWSDSQKTTWRITIDE